MYIAEAQSLEDEFTVLSRRRGDTEGRLEPPGAVTRSLRHAETADAAVLISNLARSWQVCHFRFENRVINASDL